MSFSRRTAFVALVTIGMVAAAAPPAALAATSSASTSWHLIYRAPSGHDIQGIAAGSRTQAWAFGDVVNTKTNRANGFFYLHWNGKSWRPVGIAAARHFVPEQIEASSASNVWVLGYTTTAGGGGAALVYNGRAWHLIAAPWPNDPLALEVVASPADVWLVSSYGGSTTALAHWNGASWISYTVAGRVSLAGGSSRPWLTGTAAGAHGVSLEIVYRWSGTRWQRESTPGHSAALVNGAAATDGRLWLATRGRGSKSWRLYERRGAKWSPLAALPGFTSTAVLDSLIYDGHNGFFDLPYRWTGRHWVRTMPNFPSSPWWFNSFWYNNVAPVPGTASAWAVILANTSPTSGVQVSAIAADGKTP
jgi:hypothetical protein